MNYGKDKDQYAYVGSKARKQHFTTSDFWPLPQLYK
jgi:hypothetical protein